MDEFEKKAERIIKLEGLTFALAAKAGNKADIAQARHLLKRAIIRALEDAFERGESWEKTERQDAPVS